MNRLAPVLLIVIAAAGHATELCVVEPAIGFEDGKWTYMTGVGPDDLPDFGKRWVVTNAGSHGYGCGCMTVKVDAKEKTVLSVRKVKVQAISKCRNDKDLPKHGKE